MASEPLNENWIKTLQMSNIDPCPQAAAEILALRAENLRLRAALTDTVFALDGIVDGDFKPDGQSAKGALDVGLAALSALHPQKETE